MSSWCYCPRCDTGQGRPSPYEVMEGQRECHVCRFTFPTLPRDKDDLICDMAERINNLEQAVQDLAERLNQSENP